MRQVMLIDLQRCIGCHSCLVACKSENNLPANVFWNKVITGSPDKPNENLFMDTPRGSISAAKGGLVNDRKNGIVAVDQSYYTKACQHCAEPACVDVCPTNASFIHPNGVVDVKTELCIGCDSCIEACPYDVRHHNTENEKYWLDFPTGGQGIMPHTPETVDKCNFCQHRLVKGELPFCVVNCSSAARFSGDIDDPKSEVSQVLKKRKYIQLRPEEGTKPSVYFLT